MTYDIIEELVNTRPGVTIQVEFFPEPKDSDWWFKEGRWHVEYYVNSSVWDCGHGHSYKDALQNLRQRIINPDVTSDKPVTIGHPLH